MASASFPVYARNLNTGENSLTGTVYGGWAYEYSRGRVCYMSSGHLLSDLWHPEFVKLKHNAVRWILHQKS